MKIAVAVTLLAFVTLADAAKLMIHMPVGCEVVVKCVLWDGAMSASVQMSPMGDRWFNDTRRAAQLLGHEAPSAEDRVLDHGR